MHDVLNPLVATMKELQKYVYLVISNGWDGMDLDGWYACTFNTPLPAFSLKSSLCDSKSSLCDVLCDTILRTHWTSCLQREPGRLNGYPEWWEQLWSLIPNLPMIDADLV